MEVWLNAGFIPPTELTTLAAAAEPLGFTGIELPDHLFFPADISSPYPYTADGEVLWPAKAPWPDPWVAIGAMAAVTSTLQFGTGVQIAPLRDPFTLAKAIATAHSMSEGRTRCGFGVGWLREEFDVMGIDFTTRGRRMDELLTVLRLLLTGDPVSHAGDFFGFDGITMQPSAAGVPILIGGNSDAALARAAGQDGWIGTHRTVAETAELIERLEPHLEDSRTDRFTVALTGPDLVGEDLGALGALGVDAVTLPIAALGRARDLDDRLELLRSAARELAL